MSAAGSEAGTSSDVEEEELVDVDSYVDEDQMDDDDGDGFHDVDELERRREELRRMLAEYSNENENDDSLDEGDTTFTEDSRKRMSDDQTDESSAEKHLKLTPNSIGENGASEPLPTTPFKDGRCLSPSTSDIDFSSMDGSFLNESGSSPCPNSSLCVPPTPRKCPFNGVELVETPKCNSPQRDVAMETPAAIEEEEMQTDDFNAHDLLEKVVDETCGPNERFKRVPAYRRTDILEPLPEGWREITHSSGITVYLHNTLRVCTLSRPYYLGRGSARNHEVPLCSIACLHERKLNEFVDIKRKGKVSENQTQPGQSLPVADVQGEESGLNALLGADDLYSYASKVFRINKIKVKQGLKRRFGSHVNGPEEESEKPTEAGKEPVQLPDGDEENDDEADGGGVSRGVVPKTLVVSAPAGPTRRGKPVNRAPLSVLGKTAIAALHDHTQRYLKGHVRYEFSEMRSGMTPYACTIRLTLTASQKIALTPSIREKLAILRQQEELEKGGAQDEGQLIGRGSGASKKASKMCAAMQALKLLIPNIQFNTDGIVTNDGEKSKSDIVEDAASVFETVPLDDRRILKLTERGAVPAPNQLLRECIQRKSKFSNLHPIVTTEHIGHRKMIIRMKLGDIEVETPADSRRDGEHYCAQLMLKKMHEDEPDITTYGALLRLYVTNLRTQYHGVKAQREITKLQSIKATHNAAVTTKLFEEMRKIDAGVPRLSGLCTTRPPLQTCRCKCCCWRGEEGNDRAVVAQSAAPTSSSCPISA